MAADQEQFETPEKRVPASPLKLTVALVGGRAPARLQSWINWTLADLDATIIGRLSVSDVRKFGNLKEAMPPHVWEPILCVSLQSEWPSLKVACGFAELASSGRSASDDAEATKMKKIKEVRSQSKMAHVTESVQKFAAEHNRRDAVEITARQPDTLFDIKSNKGVFRKPTTANSAMSRCHALYGAAVDAAFHVSQFPAFERRFEQMYGIEVRHLARMSKAELAAQPTFGKMPSAIRNFSMKKVRHNMPILDQLDQWMERNCLSSYVSAVMTGTLRAYIDDGASLVAGDQQYIQAIQSVQARTYDRWCAPNRRAAKHEQKYMFEKKTLMLMELQEAKYIDKHLMDLLFDAKNGLPTEVARHIKWAFHEYESYSAVDVFSYMIDMGEDDHDHIRELREEVESELRKPKPISMEPIEWRVRLEESRSEYRQLNSGRDIDTTDKHWHHRIVTSFSNHEWFEDLKHHISMKLDSGHVYDTVDLWEEINSFYHYKESSGSRKLLQMSQRIRKVGAEAELKVREGVSLLRVPTQHRRSLSIANRCMQQLEGGKELDRRAPIAIAITHSRQMGISMLDRNLREIRLLPRRIRMLALALKDGLDRRARMMHTDMRCIRRISL